MFQIFTRFKYNNSKMMYVLTILAVTSSVSAFYPRQPPPEDWRTKTHFDITLIGTLQAISTYVFKNNMTNAKSESSALDEFFTNDYNGWTAMLTTINTVRESVADTQEKKRGIPYVHCHADQIKLAHTHVIACRDRLLSRKDDINELQKLIGECLYTIQSFYSNTNWVEMFGKIPYLDFGIKGTQLMRVARSDEDTCLDMKDSLVSCKDNLFVTHMLTSGFHHGRANRKPARPKNALKGKCSHGGLNDDSRNLIAKCGINKETTVEALSPHYHLHHQAYEAAVEATKQFLIAVDTGILNILGDELFKTLFQIKQRTQVSLSFAVDFSGSMGGEIAAVKEQINQLVTSTIGSNNEPADYVLSLFNDPASLTEGFVYTSGQDMIDKIATIDVSGGGDCPEFAAAGILKAIELSKPRSTVIVFTDADAKDADRLQEVTDAAQAKNIPITSVLSSQCSSRKRRDILVRKRRDTQLFYQSLSESTGGTVYSTDKDNFGSVLTEVVEVVFPTSEVLIETYEWQDNEVGNKLINVDGSIKLLKISIKGGSEERDIDFLFQNGTAITFPSTGASRVITSNNEVIMSIQNLTHGAYFLRKNINHTYVINITAQSSIKLVDGMYEKSTSGSLVTLKGSPVSGNNYTYFVVVFNMVNGTCNNLYMVNSSGYNMVSYTLDSRSSEYDMLCSTDIVIPDYAFQMKLNVSNVFGDPVVRTVRSVYRPTSVELNVIASSDDVPIGNKRVVTYEVTNTGAIIDSYIVQISDDHSYVLAPDSMNHTLGPGEKTEGNFTLLPNSTIGLFKYTVAVFVNSSAEVKQTISRTLIVTDIQRPNCNVLMTSGECNVPSLNTANCSQYAWSAKAEVTFKGTQLESISSTIGNHSVLQYANISGRMGGPVAVNISGNCCNPSLSISAVDVDGYISQCPFELSNGLPVQSVDPIIEQVIHPILNTNIFSKTFAVIVAVSVCFVVMCIVIFAGVITYKYFGQTKRMKEKHVNSKTHAQNRTRKEVENKPKTNGQNRPYSFENRLVRCKDRHNDSYIEWY